MRPKTGLRDMFLELDPGTEPAGEYEEGDTVPVSSTAPDVNLDEVLEALDTDTRAYLRMLLVGGEARAVATTSASCSAASGRSTATSPSSTARSPSAATTSPT